MKNTSIIRVDPEVVAKHFLKKTQDIRLSSESAISLVRNSLLEARQKTSVVLRMRLYLERLPILRVFIDLLKTNLDHSTDDVKKRIVQTSIFFETEFSLITYANLEDIKPFTKGDFEQFNKRFEKCREVISEVTKNLIGDDVS